MGWYKTGTIAISGVTVTGTGTNWTDNKQGIGPGQALLIPAAGTVKMYEILRVDSATKLTLTSDAGTVAAGQAYAIMRFYSDSVPDFARRLSAQLSYYQTQMDGWQQIMTGTGSINLTAPDGTTVTISSFKKLTDDMDNKADKDDLSAYAKKGQNSDITSLSGLTTPLSTGQGGTGRNDGRAAFTRISSADNRDASVVINSTGFPADRVGGMVLIQCTSSSGNPYIYVMRTDGGSAGQITCKLPDTSGTLAVQGTSGRNFKDDITPADPQEALARVMGLDLVNFVYKDDEHRRVRFGFIAEEAEEGAPQYIKHREFPIPGTGVYDEEGVKISEQTEDRPAVDNNPIVMDLLGCVQAQQRQIEELKNILSTITER